MGIWNYFTPDIQESTENDFSYVKFIVIASGISLVLFGTGYAMIGLAKVTTSLKDTTSSKSKDTTLFDTT